MELIVKSLVLVLAFVSCVVHASEIDELRVQLADSRMLFYKSTLENTEANLEFSMRISKLIKEGRYQKAAEEADFYIETVEVLLPDMKPSEPFDSSAKKEQLKRYRKIEEMIRLYRENN